MTAANGLSHENLALTPLRRYRANVAAAVTLIARRRSLRPWPGIEAARRFAVWAAAFAVAFALCMGLLDHSVAQAMSRLPHWIVWPFDVITDFGKSGWFLWPLGVLLLVLAGLPARLTRMSQAVLAAIAVRVGFLFAAIAVPGIAVTIIKHIVGRGRPRVGHFDPFLFAPLNWPAAYASLPSGHATTAFSVCVAFGALWPRWRIPLFVYAVLIALSRLVVLAHFPSDVLAGAAVGSLGALMVRQYFALHRLGFSVGPDGAIRPYAGPSLRRIKAVARALLTP